MLNFDSVTTLRLQRKSGGTSSISPMFDHEKDPRRAWMCVAHDGTVVGFAEAMKEPNTVTITRGGEELSPNFFYVPEVKIRPESRGLGAGTLVVAQMKADLEAISAEKGNFTRLPLPNPKKSNN
jgi:Acetyltransferase (GNAT) family